MLTLAANPVAQSFLACLEKAQHVTKPFDYWLLKDALPPEDVEGILALPVAAPTDAEFSGRRETNNAQRMFFGADAQRRYAVCRRVADGFKDPPTCGIGSDLLLALRVASNSVASLAVVHATVRYSICPMLAKT